MIAAGRRAAWPSWAARCHPKMADTIVPTANTQFRMRIMRETKLMLSVSQELDECLRLVHSRASSDDLRRRSGNRFLTVAAPIGLTAPPTRAATVRERSLAHGLFSRKAPPCACERQLGRLPTASTC